MIIKLVDRKEGAKGALRYARNLAVYMADADPRRLLPDAAGLDYGLTLSAYMTREAGRNEPPRERVLHRAALLGGEAAGWDEGFSEMERRLQLRSSRLKKPARHVVLSYRAGEEPSEWQCHQAIMLLAQELRCEAAAILWAAHADTDNVHIHALFVTVDPDTGAALPFGQREGGRANHKEAMQRAIALIEHAQRLQSEVGGRYEVRNGHVVRKPDRPDSSPSRKRTPLRQETLAFEERSGFASFTRVAQDVAGPILDEARSWQELHRDLAAQGIGIRPKDNGGELYAGDEHVKLSNVDRRHSWPQLVKPERLGPYAEPGGVELAPYEPRILDAARAAAWLKRRDIEQAIAARIDRRVAALIAARDAALAELKASIAAHRDDLGAFDGDARLRRDIGEAWPRLGSKAARAIAAAFDTRIAAVRALRNAVAGADDLDAIDPDGVGALEAGIVVSWHGDHGLPPVAAIEGYEAERSGDVVRYWARVDSYRRGQPAMVDAGAIIWVNETSDRTIAAALLLGKQRYGDVAVFGDQDYLAGCRVAAERVGIELTVITVTEARRRARTSARQQARRQAIETAGRNADLSRLRRWARAYVRATPREDGIEPAVQRLGSLQDLTGHAATPRVQSLDGAAMLVPIHDAARPQPQSPARSRVTSPAGSNGGIA